MVGSDSDSDSGSGSEALIAPIRPSVAFTDSRHKFDINRDELLAKVSRLRIAPVLSTPSSQKINVSEIARDQDLERGLEEPSDEQNAPAVKLQNRALLDSSSIVKQNKKDAAAAAAVAFDLNQLEQEQETQEPVKIIKVRQRKPKAAAAAAAGKEPIMPVSTSAAISKEQVAKLRQKSKDDAKQDDKFALSSALVIGDEIISRRLPEKRALPQIQASDFYMNNRAKFIQYINALFHT
jgi:hypothetical protein